MARVNEATTIPTGTRPSVRGEFTRYGRCWSSSITQLIALSVELDDSGEWALDGSPTCAHWIAATLDIEVGTAREWLRIGRALAHLPMTTNAFTNGGLSFTMRLTPARAAVLTAAVDPPAAPMLFSVIPRAELSGDERGTFLNELKQGLKRSSYLTV